MKHLALIGPPAVGKSAIGNAAAEILGIPFQDLDLVVEAETGIPVPEYLRQHGEEAFRSLESRCLTHALDSDVSVLATGGGSVLMESNRIRLRNRALVVWT
jgi:shikimate kinase